MDTVALVGRLLVSLAAVLGVLWVIGRRLKRGGRAKNTQLIDVLGRQQLSRGASVAVVRIGEQALVIGVTDAQVSVLGETDLGAAQAMVAAARAGTPDPVRAPRRASAAHRADLPAGDPAPAPAAAAAPRAKAGALSGSALSPHTWRQAVDSLRDLTARQA